MMMAVTQIQTLLVFSTKLEGIMISAGRPSPDSDSLALRLTTVTVTRRDRDRDGHHASAASDESLAINLK